VGSTEAYQKTCSFTPYPEQAVAFASLSKGWNYPRTPLILRLPCGYGKTEAVAVPFLAQALSNKWSLAPRLIYVLPTRALCNQIKERIQGYANRIEELTGKTLKVGIEHGVSSLDPLFFADVCVTTFDQFLYGYARAKPQVGRHFDLPGGAIANSIVVFDEAHLYSPYTHSLMRAMFEILHASRIPLVVMTATMPTTLEEDFFKSIGVPEKIEFSGDRPEKLANRSIRWCQKDWSLLEDDKISRPLEKLLNENKGKKILLVANRVDVAQKVAETLKHRNDFIILIHSRFTVKDREEKEKLVKKKFGKDKKRQKSGIVISTQVCEVGLDISCDLLITECASADALVQRTGRVARWGGNGKVIIVRPMGTNGTIQDGEWSEAYPYVDKKRDEESEFDGIKRGEYAGIAWEYLKQRAPENLFTDWATAADFCNLMEYHTDDVEARSALGQLFDATLYADERPWNLSARGEMYCTIAVLSEDRITQIESIPKPARTKRGKKGISERKTLPFEEMRKLLINLSFKYLVSKDTKHLRPYDYTDGTIKDALGKGRPKPFQTYILDPFDHYDSDLGLRLAKKEKPEDTEEGTSCLIL